jgi:hypothetical protein
LPFSVGIAVGIGHRTLSITSEFDDCIDPAAAAHGREPSRPRSPLPELIADAYRRAAAPLRRKLLEGLLRPVGSLALAAIASGAFSTFLLRGTQSVTLDDVARITADQVAALAGFVDQINPDILQQVLSMLA